MKLNKKGFMLAEVVVVSVVIATTLVTLYVALNRLISAFDTRNTYYDIDAAYLTVEVNNILIENGIINTLLSESEPQIKEVSSDTSNEYLDVKNFVGLYSGNKKVYFSPYNKNKIDSIKADKDKENKNNNQTFIDYIDYLSDNLNYGDPYTYVIISEICDGDNNCRYYTLKVR